MFLIVSLAGLCLIEMLTITMKTVPFTCTYLPGQLKLRLLLAVLLFPLAELLLQADRLEPVGARRWQHTLQLAAFLIAIWMVLRVWHMARAERLAGLSMTSKSLRSSRRWRSQP